MAKPFNLTAQINLRGPTNIKPVVSKIKKQLGTINADINVKMQKGAAQSIKNVSKQLNVMNQALITASTQSADLNKNISTLASNLSGFANKTIKINNNTSKTSDGIGNLGKAAKDTNDEFAGLSRGLSSATKRFAILSTAIYPAVNAIRQGVTALIDFDRQLVRLSQVTKGTLSSVKDISDEITRLSTSFGVSSKSLAEASVTLAQAGFSAKDTKTALEALAKTDLAPTFDNIASTTEGAIAALRQFDISTKDLEKSFGSINAVAAQFAVESSDIISAIQRTGGVFASASKGVSQGTDALNEFIAIFTSVRSTTRESAETIATGLRTIFTRIQRGSTIEYLKQFGVELQNSQGQFVGAYEAIKRLSEGLKDIDPRDVRFNKIVEELGGFRQIGKVIPLIQQFGTAASALKVAQQGQASLASDAAKAQVSLAVQLSKVREEFLALTRDIADAPGFKSLSTVVLTVSKNILSLARSISGFAPLFAGIFAIKNAGAISKFIQNISSGITGLFKTKEKGSFLETLTNISGRTSTITVDSGNDKLSNYLSDNTKSVTDNTSSLDTLTTAINSLINRINAGSGVATISTGGKVLGFATGGVVPGSGNRDSVPAMLTPGEVVINKKAANKYGRGNLVRMNKYAWGGKLSKLADIYTSIADTDNYEQFEDDIVRDRSKFIEVKPTPKDKADFAKMKGKRSDKFERFVQRKYNLGKRATGKYDYLDFPATRAEAKFLPFGTTYDYSEKGNTPKSIAAKNFLFENSYYSPNQKNQKVKEIETERLTAPVKTYWSDPSKWKNGGLIQKLSTGGMPNLIDNDTVGVAILDQYEKTTPLLSAEQIAQYTADAKTQNPEQVYNDLISILNKKSYKIIKQGLDSVAAQQWANAIDMESEAMLNRLEATLGGGSTSGFTGNKLTNSTRGDIFENLISRMQGLSSPKNSDFFDFRTGFLPNITTLFPDLKGINFVDAKVANPENADIGRKIGNELLRAHAAGVVASATPPPGQNILDKLSSQILGSLTDQQRIAASRNRRFGFGKASGKWPEITTIAQQAFEDNNLSEAAGVEQLKQLFEYTGTGDAVSFQLNKVKNFNTGGLVQRFAKGGSADNLVQDLQKAALKEYTLGDHKAINSSLRKDETLANADAKIKQTVSSLDQLMKYDVPSDLYSGIGSGKTSAILRYAEWPGDYESLIGQHIDFADYFSTSTNRDVADLFAGSESGSSMLDIKPKGKGLDVIQAYKDFGLPVPQIAENDQEFILPRGSSFRIDNAKGNDGSYFDLTQLKAGGLIQKFANAGRVEDQVKKGKRAKKFAQSLLGKTYPQETLRDTAQEGKILDELESDPFLDDLLSEFEGQGIGSKTSAANKQFFEAFRNNLVVQEYALGDFGPNATPEMKQEALDMGDAMRVDRDISVKRASRSKTDEQREANIAAGDLAYLVPTKAKVLLKKFESEAIDKKRARQTKAEKQDIFNPEQLEVLKSQSPEKRKNIEERAKEYLGMLDFAASQVGGDPNELRLEQQQLLQEFIQKEMNPVGSEAERLQNLQSLIENADVAQLDGDPDLAKSTNKLIAKWNSSAKKGDWTKLELDQRAVDAILEEINDPNIFAALSEGKLGRAAKKFQEDFSKALAGEPLKNVQSARDLQQIVKALASANYASGGLVQTFARGGTVPAMVSNGEAFVPPNVAKRIGYGKLAKMNQADKNGIGKFAGGGVSVFKGPGNGTSDSIGPIGLPVGSFVLREKATKALGFARGGAVGSMQNFAVGGVTEILSESSGLSVKAFNKKLSKEMDFLALDIIKTLKETRKSFVLDVGKAQTGLAAGLDPDQIQQSINAAVAGMAQAGGIDDTKTIQTASEDLFKGVQAGLGLDEVINNSKDLAAIFNKQINTVEALDRAMDQLSIQTGIAKQDLANIADVQRTQAIQFFKGDIGKGFEGILTSKFPKTMEKILNTSFGRSFSKLDSSLDKFGISLGQAIQGLSVGLTTLTTNLDSFFPEFGNTPQGKTAKEVTQSAAGGSIIGGQIGKALLGQRGQAIGAIAGAISAGVKQYYRSSEIRNFEKSLANLNTIAEKTAQSLSAISAQGQNSSDSLKQTTLADIKNASTEAQSASELASARKRAVYDLRFWIKSNAAVQDSFNLLEQSSKQVSDNIRSYTANIVEPGMSISDIRQRQQILSGPGSSIDQLMGSSDVETLARANNPNYDNLDAARQRSAKITAMTTLAENAFIQKRIAEGKTLEQAQAELAKDRERSLGIGRRELIEQEKRRLAVLESAKAIQSLTNTIKRFDMVLSKTDAMFNRLDKGFENLMKNLDSRLSLLEGDMPGFVADTRRLDILQNPEGGTPQEYELAARSVAMSNPDTAPIAAAAIAAENVRAIIKPLLRDTSNRDLGAVNQEIQSTVLSSLGVQNLADLPDTTKDAIKSLFGDITSQLEPSRQDASGTSFDAIADKLDSIIGETGRKAQETLVSIEQENIKRLERHSQLLQKENDIINKRLGLMIKANTVSAEFAIAMKEATSQTISLQELNAGFDNEIRALTGGITDPRAMEQEIRQRTRFNDQLQSRINELAQSPNTQSSQQEQEALATQMAENQRVTSNLIQALNKVADNSFKLNNAIKKSNELRDRAKTGKDLVQKIFSGDPEAILQIQQEMGIVQQAMAGNGDFFANNPMAVGQLMGSQVLGLLPETMRNQLEGFAASQAFGGMGLPQDILGGLNQMVGQALGTQTNPYLEDAKFYHKQQMEAIAAQQKLTEDQQRLVSDSVDIVTGNADQNNKFAVLLDDFFLFIGNDYETIVRRAYAGIAEQIKQAVGNQRPPNRVPLPTPQPALPFAKGGPVYANNGMFVSQGTDTVPAMLTPGEFVINKEQTNKNRGLLEAINGGKPIYSSKGGPIYLADGGMPVVNEDRDVVLRRNSSTTPFIVDDTVRNIIRKRKVDRTPEEQAIYEQYKLYKTGYNAQPTSIDRQRADRIEYEKTGGVEQKFIYDLANNRDSIPREDFESAFARRFSLNVAGPLDAHPKYAGYEKAWKTYNQTKADTKFSEEKKQQRAIEQANADAQQLKEKQALEQQIGSSQLSARIQKYYQDIASVIPNTPFLLDKQGNPFQQSFYKTPDAKADNNGELVSGYGFSGSPNRVTKSGKIQFNVNDQKRGQYDLTISPDVLSSSNIGELDSQLSDSEYYYTVVLKEQMAAHAEKEKAEKAAKEAAQAQQTRETRKLEADAKREQTKANKTGWEQRKAEAFTATDERLNSIIKRENQNIEDERNNARSRGFFGSLFTSNDVTYDNRQKLARQKVSTAEKGLEDLSQSRILVNSISKNVNPEGTGYRFHPDNTTGREIVSKAQQHMDAARGLGNLEYISVESFMGTGQRPTSMGLNKVNYTGSEIQQQQQSQQEAISAGRDISANAIMIAAAPAGAIGGATRLGSTFAGRAIFGGVTSAATEAARSADDVIEGNISATDAAVNVAGAGILGGVLGGASGGGTARGAANAARNAARDRLTRELASEAGDDAAAFIKTRGLAIAQEKAKERAKDLALKKAQEESTSNLLLGINKRSNIGLTKDTVSKFTPKPKYGPTRADMPQLPRSTFDETNFFGHGVSPQDVAKITDNMIPDFGLGMSRQFLDDAVEQVMTKQAAANAPITASQFKSTLQRQTTIALGGFGAYQYGDTALSNIADFINPQNKADGGIIYANKGMFIPKGTDTVPAMLTPGEFVINRSATQKNRGLLESINNGSVTYAQQGGVIGGGSVATGPGVGIDITGFQNSVTMFDMSVQDFSSYIDSFVSYVDRLSKIELPSIPDRIDMVGTHTVDVNIRGAAAFEALEDKMQNLIQIEVGKQMDTIWQQSGGNLGRPPR